MDYISAQQAATKWGISKRRVQTLCTQKRIKDAIRIGNMWAIPDVAEKPYDGRIHSKRPPTSKEARVALKKLSLTGYTKIVAVLGEPARTKMTFISFLATALLQQALQREMTLLTFSACYETISNEIFGAGDKGQDDLLQLFFPLITDISAYIITYSDYIEDVLSWAYQYVNKKSADSGLENTQFFTEQYMIAHLTQSLSSEKIRGIKILDPACGGGNFLTHILEKALSRKDHTRQDIVQVLGSLYGYELDPNLAIVASLNLKLKALSILSRSKAVHLCDWERFCPQIYTSVETGGFGFLEPCFSEHLVKRVSDGKQITLAELTDKTMALYTNPPFQTVKGMPENLKNHLKQYFPLAKCDMCNAFFLQCLDKIQTGGIIGLVTQCSWMYLDSFATLRKRILSYARLDSIVELGTGAFYDLSGEKANVALVQMKRDDIGDRGYVKVLMLRDKSLPEKMQLLSQHADTADLFRQEGLFSGPYMAFTPTAVRATRGWTATNLYKDYATPMQGTSTGNAAELIAYYWEHFNDADWVAVSKGGGYSRWCGLNSYVLRWGRDGEYIRRTKGSALRNIKYFHHTSLVYSDTGTAGFNARLLEPGQLFVASGPGIRDIVGNPYAHLAALNGRLFSSLLRRLSPKLTIAAGYIARVPIPQGLLDLPELGQLGQVCYHEKRSFLELRPHDMEWHAPDPGSNVSSLDNYAVKLFQADISHELKKLLCEAEIDRILLEAYGLSREEEVALDASFGKPAAALAGEPNIETLDQLMSQMLDVNCQLIRTRVDKQVMGCDGLLEYVSRKEGAAPHLIVDQVLTHPWQFPQCIQKYKELCIHTLLLGALGFRQSSSDEGISLDTVRHKFQQQYPSLQNDWPEIQNWVETSFEPLHKKAFYARPYYQYENGMFTILYRGRQV